MADQIISFDLPPKSVPNLPPKEDSAASTSSDTAYAGHKEFFGLCNIIVTDDDVAKLLEDGYKMDNIYLIVQDGDREDIDEILTSLASKVPKATRSIFRNTCKLVKKYMDLFTDGKLPKSISIDEIKAWTSADRKVNNSPPPNFNNNDTIKLNESLSSITNLVNRQCQTLKDTMITPLPKIRDQQYQVEWEEDVRLIMGQNNASYLLDEKVLHDDFSECTIDENILQIQDSRFWYDLMKSVRNSDVEHTILKYESFYKSGQNRASGRKAWLAITQYRNTSEQNLLSYKVAKKAIEDLRYDAKKTQFGHFLNDFEKHFKRYRILGSRIHSYWTPTYEEERKLEVFNNTIVYSSLDPMSQGIIFREHRYPTYTYDELTQELRKAQSTLDILESISPKSNVRRTTNGNQNISNNNNGKPKNSNSEARLNVRNTTYEFENNKYVTDDKGNLTYQHINNILGKDIYKRTTHKQRASLAKSFQNAKGTFHEYVENIRKISKDYMKQNEKDNVDIAACNEKYLAERKEQSEKYKSRNSSNTGENNSNSSNTNSNENNTIRRQILIDNKSGNNNRTKTVKDSIENVIIELDDDNNDNIPENTQESNSTDFSSLRRYQNNQGIIVLDSGAQKSCNGTIGPLITYRSNKYSGVVGPSSDMTSRRINNTTSYIKLTSTDGSIYLGRLNHLQGFPEDHPHVEKETLLNPSHIRAAGHYVSDSEIKNGGLQSIVLNYDVESKKENPNYIIIPLTYYGSDCRLEFDVPTYEEIREKAYPIINLTPKKEWINNTDPKFKQIYDSSKLNLPNFKEIYDVAIRRNKVQRNPDHSASYGRWQEHLGFMNINTIEKTLLATTQLYISSEYMDSPKPLLQNKMSKFPARKYKVLNEGIEADLWFPKKIYGTSVRGYTMCITFFFRTSKFTRVTFQRRKDETISSFKTFFMEEGVPNSIKIDLAGENISEELTALFREVNLKTYDFLDSNIKFTEAHKSYANTAETGNRIIKVLAQTIMNQVADSTLYWCWASKLACDINCITAKKSLNWRTPYEIRTGNTPDISPFFKFKFLQPLKWYDDYKGFPECGDNYGRFLGIAWNTGDELTFHIEISRHKSSKPELSHSEPFQSISRGTAEPHSGANKRVDDNFRNCDRFERIQPNVENNYELRSKNAKNNNNNIILNSKSPDSQDDIDNNFIDYHSDDNNISIDEDSILNNDIPNTYEGKNNDLFEDDNSHEKYYIDSICDHREVYATIKRKDKKSVKQLRVVWNSGEITWEPFLALKIDVPEMVADYILKIKPKGWNRQIKWASQLSDVVRRYLFRRLVDSDLIRIRRTTKDNNWYNTKLPPPVIHGVEIPRTVDEAFKFDRLNENSLWTDAINKEMSKMDKLDVFKYEEGVDYSKLKDFQFAPLRMIFTVKNNLTRKARLIGGGHKTTADTGDQYASMVKTENFRLMMLLTLLNSNKLALSGDISTAYINALSREKIYTKCGREFPANLQGKFVRVHKALYGLITSGHAWYAELNDFMRTFGWAQSRADPSIWIKEDDGSYQYAAFHVDDFVCVSSKPDNLIYDLEKVYDVTGKEEPKFHLGTSIDKTNKGFLVMSASKYINNILPTVDELTKSDSRAQHKTPLPSCYRPEEDLSELLDDAGKKLYMRLIGILQWIVNIGRIDICYAVNSMSRFNQCPRVNQIKHVTGIFHYLRKYPNKSIRISSDYIDLDKMGAKKLIRKGEWNDYYRVIEEMDEKHPESKGKPVETTIFVDSNWAGDTDNRRSTSGIVAYVNSTPYRWLAKKQDSTNCSSFTAEFSAMRKAVELARNLRYTLRSLGLPIKGPTRIVCDNESVVKQTSQPGSPLENKALGITYHFVRESCAMGAVEIYWIAGKENPADILTKNLSGPVFHKHLDFLMHDFEPIASSEDHDPNYVRERDKSN